MALRRQFARRDCLVRAPKARGLALHLALVAFATISLAHSLRADDTIQDNPQSTSGTRLIFRSAASRPKPDDSDSTAADPAAVNSTAINSTSTISPAADPTSPGSNSSGVQQRPRDAAAAARDAADYLRGSSPAGDPFWPVHLAASQETIPQAAGPNGDVIPRPIELPPGTAMPGPNAGSPRFLPSEGDAIGGPPLGAPSVVGPSPSDQGPNRSQVEWPHSDLRSQFGEPLIGASWNNRPYEFGGMIGFISASELIHNKVDQNAGFIGGFRLGWDYDTYWGIEGRLAFASIQTQTEVGPVFDSSNQATFWDTSLLYYPWGDSRWRPYFTIGAGLAEFRFFDENMIKRSRGLLSVPIGGGLKYRMHDCWTLRFDLLDNVQLGDNGLDTMNNFSFTSGVEYRFGGSHKSYWPWDPNLDN